MELYERVRVTFPPSETHYKHVSEANLWEVICHPLRNPPHDNEPCDRVTTYPHDQYTGSQAGHLYWRADGWRNRLHKHFQRIEPKDAVLEVSRSIFPDVIKQSIAVIHRAERGLAREQLTGELPSVEDMCEAVNKISQHTPVLVCADSSEATDEFRRRLKERALIWNGLDHVPAGSAPHFRDNYGNEHVHNMFARTLALSQSSHLVHPVSNIATAALYMNPALRHTFVEVPRKNAAK
jgi:hypothetical protein